MLMMWSLFQDVDFNLPMHHIMIHELTSNDSLCCKLLVKCPLVGPPQAGVGRLDSLTTKRCCGGPMHSSTHIFIHPEFSSIFGEGGSRGLEATLSPPCLFPLPFLVSSITIFIPSPRRIIITSLPTYS